MPIQHDLPRKKQAVDVLNDLVLDLMVGLRSWDLFAALNERHSLSSNLRAGLGRMSTMHLILSLAKWEESYDRYKQEIPCELVPIAKRTSKEIGVRGVRIFRNKVVGHIWDKEKRRPLDKSETVELLARVVGADQAAFYRWIFRPEPACSESHVVGIAGLLRDRITEEIAAVASVRQEGKSD